MGVAASIRSIGIRIGTTSGHKPQTLMTTSLDLTQSRFHAIHEQDLVSV
jgi:hypothetical protein